MDTALLLYSPSHHQHNAVTDSRFLGVSGVMADRSEEGMEGYANNLTLKIRHHSFQSSLPVAYLLPSNTRPIFSPGESCLHFFLAHIPEPPPPPPYKGKAQLRHYFMQQSSLAPFVLTSSILSYCSSFSFITKGLFINFVSQIIYQSLHSWKENKSWEISFSLRCLKKILSKCFWFQPTSFRETLKYSKHEL